ncbi:hypothetical protein HRbin36_01107 [bacterium HR36]|nr:hypothetical protein HRbin36_01107 [bacterium HR36]
MARVVVHQQAKSSKCPAIGGFGLGVLTELSVDCCEIGASLPQLLLQVGALRIHLRQLFDGCDGLTIGLESFPRPASFVEKISQVVQ